MRMFLDDSMNLRRPARTTSSVALVIGCRPFLAHARSYVTSHPAVAFICALNRLIQRVSLRYWMGPGGFCYVVRLSLELCVAFK
jgi:hypothetical protein